MKYGSKCYAIANGFSIEPFEWQPLFDLPSISLTLVLFDVRLRPLLRIRSAIWRISQNVCDTHTHTTQQPNDSKSKVNRIMVSDFHAYVFCVSHYEKCERILWRFAKTFSICWPHRKTQFDIWHFSFSFGVCVCVARTNQGMIYTCRFVCFRGAQNRTKKPFRFRFSPHWSKQKSTKKQTDGNDRLILPLRSTFFLVFCNTR